MATKATPSATEPPGASNSAPGCILATVEGQAPALTTLRRALASGRVHHAYLFVGRDVQACERAAIGMAQSLVCEAPSEGLACGTCSACRRAAPVEGKSRHPDIVFLERGLYEPGQIGRKTPETQDISVDQVRTLVLARAAFGPHEGRAKVFIIRRAEELSIAAANALLKTLEEPLPRTHFILLTAQRAELLSTVQSRALPVRFIDRADPTGSEMDDDDSALGPALWRVATAKTFSAALDLGASMKKPRDELAQELESAAQWFAARAKRELADPEMSMYCAHVYQWILDAKHDVLGNAAAQLRLEELVSKMRRELPS